MRQRPMSILIFGILNIGYALMYLAGLLLALLKSVLGPILKFPSSPALDALKSDPSYVQWSNFNMGLSVIFGLALMAFGIGLLLLKNWARIGSMVYAVIQVVYAPLGSVVAWRFMSQVKIPTPGVPPGLMAAMMMMGLVLGIIVGVGYAALLLFFMTRSNVIEACQPEQPPPPPA
jgi:hypothetical protein